MVDEETYLYGVKPSILLKHMALGVIGFVFFYVGLVEQSPGVMLLSGLLSLGVNGGICYAIARFKNGTGAFYASLAYSTAPFAASFMALIDLSRGRSVWPFVILTLWTFVTIACGWAGRWWAARSR
jgi:hypothetical protein